MSKKESKSIISKTFSRKESKSNKTGANSSENEESINLDVKQLNDFLRQLQGNTDFSAFYEMTYENDESDFKWNATEYTVYELSNATNILLSCEYGRTIYIYITLIDDYFKEFMLDLKYGFHKPTELND